MDIESIAFDLHIVVAIEFDLHLCGTKQRHEQDRRGLELESGTQVAPVLEQLNSGHFYGILIADDIG